VISPTERHREIGGDIAVNAEAVRVVDHRVDSDAIGSLSAGMFWTAPALAERDRTLELPS